MYVSHKLNIVHCVFATALVSRSGTLVSNSAPADPSGAAAIVTMLPMYHPLDAPCEIGITSTVFDPTCGAAVVGIKHAAYTLAEYAAFNFRQVAYGGIRECVCFVCHVKNLNQSRQIALAVRLQFNLVPAIGDFGLFFTVFTQRPRHHDVVTFAIFDRAGPECI
jgi:hypothetical protein